MNLQAQFLHNIPVLALTGRLDTHTVPDVRKWLEKESPQYLVIDLSQVNFVDSSALATLVFGLKMCRNQDGDLWLAGLQEPVKVIFGLTRLEKAFRIFPDVETAVSTINNQA